MTEPMSRELNAPPDVLPNRKFISTSLPKDALDKPSSQALSWACDYCGTTNNAKEPACRGCGVPNPQGEASGAAPKKVDVFMDAVASSVLAAVGYDEYAKRLVVRFKSGATYEYLNIPEPLYAELMASNAKGKFYSAHIRGKFDGRKL